MPRKSEGLFISSYSNLALYEAGDVFTGVENRKRPHDVLLQPIPVLNDFLFGDTLYNIKSGKKLMSDIVFSTTFLIYIYKKKDFAWLKVQKLRKVVVAISKTTS